jgi:hypothetical protein
MSNSSPHIKDDPMYRLLREGAIEEFNTRRSNGESCDLVGCDLRTIDLRRQGPGLSRLLFQTGRPARC